VAKVVLDVSMESEMRKLLHPDFEIVYTPQIHSQAYVVRSIHDQMQRDFEDRAVDTT
jgi:hypothetical protein